MFQDRCVSFVGFLCLSWLCMGFSLVAPASASDDFVLVSRQETSVSIAVSDLLANDSGALALVSFTPTVRGTLNLVGSTLVYAAGTSFFDAGSDSFSYVYSSSKGNSTAVVYLIADLKVNLEFSESVDDPLLPDWLKIDPQNNLAVAAPPQSQNPALEVDFDGGAVAYIEHLIIDRAPTVTGGDTDFVIDPGADGIGEPPVGSNAMVTGASPGGINNEWVYEMVVASGSSQGGETSFEVVVQEAASGRYLLARAQHRIVGGVGPSSLVWTSTAPVAVSSEKLRIGLTWWLAEDGKDGGLLLMADGKLISWITGIDNSAFDADTWRFGSIEAPTGAAGRYYFDDIELWAADDPPAFPPLLADGFESGGLELWGLGDGFNMDPEVNASAALSGFYGLEVTMPASGSSYVFKSSATALRSLRAKLKLRLSADFAMVDTKSVDLLCGERGGTVEDPVRLRLRQFGSQLKLKAMARQHAGGWATTNWVAVPKGQVIEVELHWWGSLPQQSNNGGLWLKVDGAAQSKSQLDNGGFSLDEVRFGLNVVPAGGVGTLHLDEIEGWR